MVRNGLVAAVAVAGFLTGASVPWIVVGEQGSGGSDGCQPGQYFTSSFWLWGYPLSDANRGAYAFTDDDADGGFDMSEPVYMHPAGNGSQTVEPLDVRLVNPGQFERGSQVLEHHPDVGNPLTMPDFVTRYFDADGDAANDRGETVYLSMESPFSTTVSVLDVRLAPESEYGSVVKPGDSDINNPLVPITVPVQYIDVDGSGSYGRDDVLVADLNFDGAASARDFCLSATRTQPATTTSNTPTTTSTTPTTSSTSPTTQPPPPPAPAPPATSQSGDPTADPPRTLDRDDQDRLRRLREGQSEPAAPWGGFAVLLAAGAVAIHLSRRR